MKEKDFITYKNWFFTYTDSFLTSDQNFNYHIILKREHCKRVAEEIVCLGTSLGLHPENLRLAEVTGLYHDLGRFEQYKTY
ncbi:MAG: HD domain-containing protein, partial [bacterium]